jgi:hypothetical protein
MAAFTLLSAVTATGAGNAVTSSYYRSFTAFYNSTGTITTGATINLEAQVDGSTWLPIDTRTFTSTTTRAVVQFDGVFSALRANLTARTDGTYTVSLDAAADR